MTTTKKKTAPAAKPAMAQPKTTAKVILLVPSRDKDDKRYGVGAEVELPVVTASILVGNGHAELVEGESLPKKEPVKPVLKVAGE